MAVVVRACRGEAEFPALVAIWRSAVEATHDFLSAEDRALIEAELPATYLPNVHVSIAEIDGQPVAFAGTAAGRLEMLFVDDAFRGRGIGSTLLDHVMRADGVTAVDVNEQNPQAVTFYTRRGFEIIGRSERDNDGRPYPLLHMQMTGGRSAPSSSLR
ncbi:MAG: acetyltransferase [Thermomicrobiales bacterium]|nr:acetyltransferase [Thermomicrobiales bacterium]